MTNEEKELLLKDLCARLPYDVKILTNQSKICATLLRGGRYDDGNDYFIATRIGCALKVDEFKPYLRSMSSMTEEEREEERKLWDIITTTRNDLHYLYTEFLVSHHFDYRRLIEKGLALSAPDGMYKD